MPETKLFQLQTEVSPKGDQPGAIEKLVDGRMHGKK